MKIAKLSIAIPLKWKTFLI